MFSDELCCCFKDSIAYVEGNVKGPSLYFKSSLQWLRKVFAKIFSDGGEAGIRTLGGVAPTTIFPPQADSLGRARPSHF